MEDLYFGILAVLGSGLEERGRFSLEMLRRGFLGFFRLHGSALWGG